MRKHTPESRAWQIVAEEFEAGRTSELLCPTIRDSSFVRHNARIAAIPLELRQKMKRFIDEMLGGDLFAYTPSYEAHTQEQRDARLGSLLLFAEMAKDGRAATNA